MTTTTLRKLFGLAAIALATQAVAQVTFYEGEGFRGRALTVDREIRNFERIGFNDRPHRRSSSADAGKSATMRASRAHV